MNNLAKLDPIWSIYYKPLEIADKCLDAVFYFGVLLSFAVVFSHWFLLNEFSSNLIQILFVLTVIIIFTINLSISVYFMPRAEDKRREDFLSHAYGVSLNDKETVGYYNNDQIDSFRRIGMQCLENSFFSKATLLKMAKIERWKIAAYLFAWLTIALIRSNDLELVAVITQVVFSEQLLSRYVKVEWLRIRVEKVYDDLFRLFQASPNKKKFELLIQDAFVNYEVSKAKASVLLSRKIFDQLNSELSLEWMKVKQKLRLQ